MIWFEILSYFATELIQDQFLGSILWHYVYTWVGLGRVGGMPTQAIWARGDYVKNFSEMDQNFPSTEMISFVFFDIS